VAQEVGKSCCVHCKVKNKLTVFAFLAQFAEIIQKNFFLEAQKIVVVPALRFSMINKVATTHCSFLRLQIKREDIIDKCRERHKDRSIHNFTGCLYRVEQINLHVTSEIDRGRDQSLCHVI
jgi:hypothetical protein